MPIYEYSCDDCKATFEVLVCGSASNETPLCEKCKSKNVKKLLSPMSVFSSGKGAAGCTPRGVGGGFK